MIQTVTSVRSDFLHSASLHHLPASSYQKDGCRDYHNQSSSGSSDQSHCSAPNGSFYSHDSRNRLNSEPKNQTRGCLLKSRSRDRIDVSNSLEIARFINYGECYSSSLKEHAATQQPCLLPESANRSVVNSNGCQRQQSWTPQKMREGFWLRSGSDVGLNCRYGDEGLDADEEDADSASPPKIAPIGGRILTVVDHPLVKPIPYKPIVATSNAANEFSRQKDSSQNSSLDRQTSSGAKMTSHNTDDGYASRDWQNLSSSSSVSQNSFHAADLGCSSDCRPGKPSGACDPLSSRRRLNSEHGTGGGTDVERNRERHSASSCSRRRGLSFTQTPSPSDSGVGELEAMLREKELELQAMRDTMERNELAMMQVFEEKKQNWQMEMSDVVQEWQLKLRGYQQKSFRTEQSLLLQIFKLQQENKNLRQSLDRANFEKETSGQPLGIVEEDLENVRTKLEELLWEQKQSTTEIELLRSQLRSAAEEASGRSAELITAQLLVKDSEIEIECKNAEIHRLLTDLNQFKSQLSEISEKKLNLECRLKKFESSSECRSSQEQLSLAESLRLELSIVERELEELRDTLERERKQWLEEKTKVINYQKHLQLNYIQMTRKNKMLEIEVQQMSSELERHDAECQQATMDESFC